MMNYAQSRDTIYLWPDEVPGEIKPKSKPIESDNKSGNVLRISEVTNPAIIIYEPKEHLNNGVGIIVCPGGGYQILAIDLEGYEIAAWLNKLGFTAYVLPYRVPNKRKEALYDLQRAFRVIRSKKSKSGFNVKKLGVLGFSAGGSLSARASTRFHADSYPKTDAIDALSSRPDFTLLIYPAYLDEGKNRKLTPELLVDAQTPPMFIFATADDQYANSALVMATALRDYKASVELHLLPKGGHGYGIRPGNIAAETWPSLAETWLRRHVLE
ncbi:alpha/beta hydrolase [Polaribacter litorisediminis]|nr:alpha/beta hydrolase [Polaribacter litorisediminis]